MTGTITDGIMSIETFAIYAATSGFYTICRIVVTMPAAITTGIAFIPWIAGFMTCSGISSRAAWW